MYVSFHSSDLLTSALHTSNPHSHVVALQTPDISSFIDTKQFCNFDVIKRSNQQKGCCSCSVCSVHRQRSHPWGGVKLVRCGARQGLFMCRGCWWWWWGKSGDGTVTSYSQEPVPVPWPSKAWQMAPHCTDHLNTLATSHLTLIRWDTLYSAIDHSSTCPSRSHLSMVFVVSEVCNFSCHFWHSYRTAVSLYRPQPGMDGYFIANKICFKKYFCAYNKIFTSFTTYNIALLTDTHRRTQLLDTKATQIIGK